ncbi:MAG: tryptophan-rich sensory protein [Chloroflexi bacterium]|nr:tryptophan-rich sensory protein [Chloroflexota bacterium]
MTPEEALALVIALAVPLMVGSVGGYVTARAIPTWYRDLRKPNWNPPSRVFGPVWTVLYALMGLAAWLVWMADGPLTLFTAQLAANLLWTLVFFGLRSPGWALGEIAILWLLVALTILQFLSIVPLAGLLLVPYLLWATFAAVLNAAIWRLNRQAT